MLPLVRTRVLVVSPEGQPRRALLQAARLLRAGALVAFPTETVYGLGADATSVAAVERIFAAKERPYSDPLIVHIATVEQLPTVAAEVPPTARLLAEHFWPGPLTVILPRAASIPPRTAAGGNTIGIRVPSHPVAQALLRAAGIPIAAPSANRFMHTSPTTAAHVLADLGGRIECIVDGGAASVGVESTVVDVTTWPPRVLRPGGVTLEALRAVVPQMRGPEAEASTPDEPLRAPGQLERHYAPRTRLLTVDAQGEEARAALRRLAQAALARGDRVGALVPDEEAADLAHLGVVVHALGPADDLETLARNLYAGLRTLDAAGMDLLLAHTFGRDGLGLALWDRLRRASGGSFHTP